MTAMPLAAALRAAADGILTLEAPTGLIITYGTWLDRDDFVPLSATAPARRRSSGKPPSPHWTLATSLAQQARSGCCD